jgi:hypothetical protein
MRLRRGALLTSALAALSLMACTNHDPAFDRVGGPLPEAGLTDTGGGCTLPAPDAPGAQFPCEIEAILGHPVDGGYSGMCRRCHQDPPLNGAPFPLLKWSDAQQIYAKKPIWQRMQVAIQTDYMPYCWDLSCGKTFDPPVEPLSTDQRTALLSWLECPMPVFDLSCP